MSRGAHAAPKTRGAVAAAAGTALLKTGGFVGGLAVTCAALTTVSGHGYLEAFAAETGPVTQAPVDTSPRARMIEKIEALNKKYACSPTGLDEGVVPARSVVRVGGEVRVATFEEGWAMHLGDVPGTLVSVCAR